MARKPSSPFRHFGFPLLIVAAVACAAPPAPVVSSGTDVPSNAVRQQQQVLHGRNLVLNHGCGDCHGGFAYPAADGFLAGWRPTSPPAVQDYQIGPFHTYARNLTPDNATGIGRFSERQIFNALRYGLRPGETPDVEITSGTPGQGNFPANPKYLAPPMPWVSFRHMSDQELWAIAAYLKRGVAPVSNRVPDSEGPPDFWASEYTTEKYGTHPAAPFPTANEREPE